MPVVLGWWKIFIVTKFDIIILVALSDMHFGHISTIYWIKCILKIQSLSCFKLLFPDRWEQQTSYIYSPFHLCLLKFSLFNICCIPGDNAETFTFGMKVLAWKSDIFLCSLCLLNVTDFLYILHMLHICIYLCTYIFIQKCVLLQCKDLQLQNFKSFQNIKSWIHRWTLRNTLWNKFWTSLLLWGFMKPIKKWIEKKQEKAFLMFALYL